MAVDDILKKIRADAEEAARQIVAEGKAAADAVLADAAENLKSRKAELTARAEQRAQEERNRITTLARLAARRELLDEKQALIDRVFDEARKRISGMEKAEYRTLISKIAAASPYVEKLITFEFSTCMSPNAEWGSSARLLERYVEALGIDKSEIAWPE